MMKKALLGLVCGAMLVMVPACGKSKHSAEENRISREHLSHHGDVSCKNGRCEEKHVEKKSCCGKERAPKKTVKRTMKKTTVKTERVGKELRDEEMNEEDKD
ncbi:MAG: hypothetical protein P4L31_05595 [Candidatus Babeliales bacterium]|nr:hypothetical protein [Candidatus Babeliales bacterium]